jgi:glucosamine--fructose-6-phosphate aminotransferase (isomerizing)
LDAAPGDQLLFTGCGSTYYLALAAAALYRQATGLRALALPASEIWLNPDTAPPPERALLVAVSRSGATTETVRACARWRAAGGPVLTLSAYPGRELTMLGNANLVLPSAQEQSIAQTRAFTTLYLAAVALAAFRARDEALWASLQRLPSLLARLFDRHAAMLTALGEDLSIDRFYFLGSGPRYGLASEVSLKMKEMTLSHSEPFYTLEFRHGPKSMVGPGTLVYGLLSEAHRAQERAVLEEMRALGGRILTAGERDSDISFLAGPGEPPLGEAAASLLYVPVGQVIALARALAKGLDPDHPTNLDAVVVLGA